MRKPVKKTKAKAAVPAPQAAEPSSFKLVFLGWYGVIGTTLGLVSPVKLPWADIYAKDYWRHALGSLLLVLMLLAGGVGLAIYLLDVNDFKDQIVSYVKTHQQRDLVLEGDIDITWFPQLGLDTGKLSLSQRNSGRNFASVNNARLYVAWWPLLRKQVRVERVVLDGVHANLVRHKDGSTNFDDLLLPAQWMGEVQFEVEKVRVLDSSLNFHDEGSDLALDLRELNLETGRLADATEGQVQTHFRLLSAQPRLDLQLHLSGHMRYEHARQRYEFSDLEGQARGEALGLGDLALDWRTSLALEPATQQLALDRFSGTARGRHGQRSFETRLSAASLRQERQQWRASSVSAGASVQQGQELLSVSLDLPALEADEKSVRGDKLQIAFDLFPGDAALQGKFETPASFELATRRLQLGTLNGSWTASHPLLAGKLNLASNGQLLLDARAQDLKLDLKTRMDESELGGSVQLQNFQTPAWTFDLAASTLDLDRYLVADWPQRLQAALLAPEPAALKKLELKGKLRADTLRVARLQASLFSAELRAGAGTFTVEPLQAKLYGGSLQGRAGWVIGEAPQFTLRQRLDGVQLDALLADLSPGEARLSGKGNLAVDLSARGNTAQALRQSLSGTASLALTRGGLAGLNLGEALLAGKEQLGLDGAVRKDGVRLTESTPYQELKATVDFAQGVASSSDLVLKAAQFSAKGEGRCTLDKGVLDARLGITVAPGLKRGTAGELAELSGISVPLHVNGPWATATLSYALGEASGSTLARLAKANQARLALLAAAGTGTAATTLNAPKTAAVIADKPSTAK